MENIEVNHLIDILLSAYTSDNPNVQKALKDFVMIACLCENIKNFNVLKRIEHLEQSLINKSNTINEEIINSLISKKRYI